MKRGKQTLLAVLLVLAASATAWAQVEKVAARAAGITWAACAGIMEISLRRLEGVDQVAISIPKQLFVVTYKPGTRFHPGDIRDAVGNAEVEVVQFQIAARGRVEEKDSKRFFLAGQDRFLLVDSPPLPVGETVRIEGIVNDSSAPLELKVLGHKPLKQ